MRDWKKEINEKYPNLIILEDIKNGKTYFKARCSIDGYEWEYKACNIMNGYGCHKCRGFELHNTETFKLKIKEMFPKINIIGEYKNTNTKIEWECIECKSKGFKKANLFLRGSGCAKCANEYSAKKRAKTTDKFKEDLFKAFGDEYKVLGEYTNIYTDVKLKHEVCGFIFESAPTNVLKKKNPSKCPKCNGGVKKKDTEYYKKEVLEMTDNEYEFVSEYKNSYTKSKYFHIICNKNFEMSPHSFKTGSRCPHCNVFTKGEMKVIDVLEKEKIEFETQKTFEDLKYKSKLKIDFYVKSLNLCIEYDGIQHFQPIKVFGGNKGFVENKKRDEIKNKYCEDKGINLLRIRYDDKDIERTIKMFIEKVSVENV